MYANQEIAAYTALPEVACRPLESQLICTPMRGAFWALMPEAGSTQQFPMKVGERLSHEILTWCGEPIGEEQKSI